MTDLSAMAGTGAGVSAGTAAAPVSASRAAQHAELAQAAKAFEAIFVRQLVGTMRGASQGESIDGSSAVDQFRELADARMADGLAERGGLGIAEMLLKQLEKRP